MRRKRKKGRPCGEAPLKSHDNTDLYKIRQLDRERAQTELPCGQHGAPRVGPEAEEGVGPLEDHRHVAQTLGAQ
jgi:hypothetical protein